MTDKTVAKNSASPELKVSVPVDAHPLVKYVVRKGIMPTRSYPADDSVSLSFVIPEALQTEFKNLVEEHGLVREPGTSDSLEFWWFNSRQNPEVVSEMIDYIIIPILRQRELQDVFRTTVGPRYN